MLFRTISLALSLSWILLAEKCSATAAKNPTTAATTSLLRLPNGRSMTVCDNIVVRDIPGGTQAVYQKGKEYLESMRNNTRKPFAKFQQKWRAGDSFCTHPSSFFLQLIPARSSIYLNPSLVLNPVLYSACRHTHLQLFLSLRYHIPLRSWRN